MFTKQNINAVAYILARLFGIVVQLATLPVLAKALGVAGVGQIVYVQSIIILLCTCVDFGFNTTATRSIANAEKAGDISTIFWSIQSFRAVVTMLLIIIISFVSNNYINNEVERSLLLISSVILVGSFFNTPWLYQGQQKIVVYVFLSLAVKVMTLIPVVLLVKEKEDLYIAGALLFGSELVIGLSLFVFSLLYLVDYRPKIDVVVLRSEIRQAFQAWLSGVVFSSTTALTPVIIGMQLGNHAVGVFGAADKVARTAHSLIWPVAQAYYPRACNIWKDEPHRTAIGYASKISGLLIGMALIGCASIFLFSDAIIGVLYSKEFKESAAILKIMTGFLFFASCTTSLSYFFFYPLGKAREVTIVNIFASLIGLLAMNAFLGAYGLKIAPISLALIELIVVVLLLLVHFTNGEVKN